MLNEKLSNEILEMAKIDQEFRKKAMADPKNFEIGKELGRIDEENTKRCKEIIDEFGWPTFELVGEDAASDFWLLVQHADHDKEFQERCLELLRKAVNDGQAFKKDLAYLEDRVLVGKGEEQKYGTQFFMKDFRFVPRPIADSENLEKRREEMGMETFQKNQERMNKKTKKYIEKMK